MDEEITIIDTKTRNEKIKNFLITNKKKIVFILGFIIFTLILFFAFAEYKDRKKVEISEKYNLLILNYNSDNKDKTYKGLTKIINQKDATYSPLSLYFIIDNDLTASSDEINKFFDLIINKVSLDKEIKNLIIYKKALYNAENVNENELLNILNPIINSDSVWKSHSLYLLAEFFYFKNELQKSKEFFNKIISLDNANQDIKIEAQKRLNRDLSE